MAGWELLQNIDEAVLMTRFAASVFGIEIIKVICGRKCPERASTGIIGNLLHETAILKRLYRWSVVFAEVSHFLLDFLQACSRFLAPRKLHRTTLRRVSCLLFHGGNACSEGGPQSAAAERRTPHGRFSHRHRPLLSSVWNSPGDRHRRQNPVFTPLLVSYHKSYKFVILVLQVYDSFLRIEKGPAAHPARPLP